jgi:hypothetical protein
MGKCWECVMVMLKAVGLDDKLFVHKSVKFHVVDDPVVVATAAFVKLGVLSYILWAMFDPGQRQYFAFEVPAGSTAMWTLSSSFPEGIPSMPAGLCDKLPEYDILYGGGWDMLDFSCREYFYGDVVRKMDEARAIQLTTVVSEKHLAWSDCLSDAGTDHSVGCQNRTTTATGHYFVPHVDDAVIVIAHSYNAPISRKSGQNPRTKIKNRKGSVMDTVEEGENIELSLRDLLKYSGLHSLEARNKQAQGSATGPPTYRQSGVVIEIQINYDNRRRLDGNKVLAEATVKFRDIGWSSFGPQMHHFERSDDRTATEYYHYGVRVVVVPTGSIGHFDLYLFLGVIAQFIVYLAIASVAADFVSNWLLGDRSVDLKYKQFDFELTHHKPESWAARMASPTDGGADVGPAPPRWYWREEPGRLTAHDPALVKAPHWVAYDDEACEKLEAAYAAFAKDPGVPDIVSNVGPARDVSVKTMKQINRKTGFERDVLRE